MKYLGMAAGIGTLIAVISGFIWFSGHELPPLKLLAVVWPAAIGTFLFMAVMIGFGYLSSRLLTRATEGSSAHSAQSRQPGGSSQSLPSNDASKAK